MLTIATVLKTKGRYSSLDVARMAHGLKAYSRLADFRLICLTDATDEVSNYVDEAIPLTYSWPHWWAKLNLFDIGKGPLLYFDLDTAIVGDIRPLAEAVMALGSDDLLMLRGFYLKDACSGIMGWGPSTNLSALTGAFAKEVMRGGSWFETSNGIGFVTEGREAYNGDQEYIRTWAKSRLRLVFAQDVQPGLYSWKVHIIPNGEQLPSDTRLVVFHGKPGIADTPLGRIQ